MATFQQLNRKKRIKKRIKKFKNYLANCPQRKGVAIQVFTISPRKPNSAIRKVIRTKLSTGAFITAYIPGEGHNLQEHSSVLIRGGSVKDLPGVSFKVVRGAYDCIGVSARKSSRFP